MTPQRPQDQPPYANLELRVEPGPVRRRSQSGLGSLVVVLVAVAILVVLVWGQG